jgi:uncharacterized membrane protein
MRVLLGVSLVLNLFVIGAVAGVFILRQQIIARGIEADPVMHAADALPPARRDAYRALMRTTLEGIRPGLRDARQIRHQAMLAIRAEPFDRAAASADLAHARADDAAARGEVEDAILTFAQSLPQDQRAVFVRGLGRSALTRWLASHPGQKPPGAGAR